MLAHDDKAGFISEDVWRAVFLVGVPNIPGIDGNPNRLKWSWGNWEPHLVFGRERGAIASRFFGSDNASLSICWKIEFQITLKPKKKNQPIFMYKKAQEYPHLFTGNSSPSIPAALTSITLVLVVLIAAKYWLCRVIPARSTVSLPIMPRANVPVRESPYCISTSNPEDLNVDWGYTRIWLFFPFAHPERQASDTKVHKSEEPVSFVKVSFVKGDDRDKRLPRIKDVVIPPIIIVTVYALTDSEISAFSPLKLKSKSKKLTRQNGVAQPNPCCPFKALSY